MSKGRARLAIAQGMSVWVLEAPDGFGDAGFHAHHAIQITAALSGTLKLATAEREMSAPILAVKQDSRHRFEAAGLLAFIFVEPESRLGRALGEALFGEDELVAPNSERLAQKLEPLRHSFESTMAREQLLQAGEEAVGALVPAADPRLPDPRVQKVIDYAASHLDEPLTLSRASTGVYLSESRLRHLFVEQTGLAFKTYLLWLRLMRAVQAYSEGSSLTEAAHAAGFSDSAHFSRIFRRTFGLPATTLTRISG